MSNPNLSSSSPASLPLIGLAVGEGTGPELATLFEEAVAAFTAAAGTAVRIHKSPVLYRTFGGVMRHGLTAAAVARSSVEDAAAYESFVRELVAAGGRAIFRTAFNAQPLYVVRERLTA